MIYKKIEFLLLYITFFSEEPTAMASFNCLRLLLTVAISGLMIGCESTTTRFTLATSSAGGAYMQVGEQLSEALEDEGYVIEVLADRKNETFFNCHLVATGQADLALIQNDTPVEVLLKDSVETGNLRSLMPLYPEILFIIYPDSLAPRNLQDLIEGKRIGMGPKSSGTARLIHALFKNFGIEESQYTPVYTSFEENILANPEIDISISVTSFNNPKIADMLTNGKLFSLDEMSRVAGGSSVDGFCINYPRASPFIIPRLTYINGPDMPVLTLAVDALLVTHSEIDVNSIYQLVSNIYNNVQSLSGMNPSLSMITEKFDPAKLNFPLHEGVRMYLRRDEPAFFERYAEVIGLIISTIVVVIGAVSSVHRYTQKKKKERIDGYYRILLDIERKLPLLKSEKAIEAQTRYVEHLKSEALEKVIEEKLAADESFRIFMEQTNYVIRLMEKKQASIDDGYRPERWT